LDPLVLKLVGELAKYVRLCRTGLVILASMISQTIGAQVVEFDFASEFFDDLPETACRDATVMAKPP
jgi:hypothetical protein